MKSPDAMAGLNPDRRRDHSACRPCSGTGRSATAAGRVAFEKSFIRSMPEFLRISFAASSPDCDALGPAKTGHIEQIIGSSGYCRHNQERFLRRQCTFELQISGPFQE
jgi:hypothetical protein